MIRLVLEIARAVWYRLSPMPSSHPAFKSNELIDYELKHKIEAEYERQAINGSRAFDRYLN